MADQAPTTARKRLRLGEPDPYDLIDKPQLPPALEAQSADVVAEFAARAGRVQALQQELKQVKERAQQQASALEDVKVELIALKASALSNMRTPV